MVKFYKSHQFNSLNTERRTFNIKGSEFTLSLVTIRLATKKRLNSKFTFRVKIQSVFLRKSCLST